MQSVGQPAEEIDIIFQTPHYTPFPSTLQIQLQELELGWLAWAGAFAGLLAAKSLALFERQPPVMIV